ncbi:MAG: ABC transporter C-terminal domain-containing protein, partial [Gemmataceae bacterium]
KLTPSAPARRPQRAEKEIRKEMKALERSIAQFDDQKRTLVAQSLEPTDAGEALRLHNEVVALTAQLNAAEERWCELQAEIDGTD